MATRGTSTLLAQGKERRAFRKPNSFDVVVMAPSRLRSRPISRVSHSTPDRYVAGSVADPVFFD